MPRVKSTVCKDNQMSAVLLVTDKVSQLTATAVQQLLPHWKWQVVNDSSRLAEAADPDALVGILFPPQSLDQSSSLWAERVTQACPSFLWIAVVAEHHCENSEFMSVVAATCHDFVTTPLEQMTELLPGILGHAAGFARLRAQLLGEIGRAHV